MDIKSYREISRLSQDELADAINAYAHRHFGKQMKKPLSQRAVSSWESKGVIPRPFWIKVIESYTKRDVTLKDFYRQNAAQAKIAQHALTNA